MSDCVFCRIIAGQIPSARVYEDETCLALLDIGPLQPGHTLLIPRRHYERLSEMTPEEMAAIGRALPGVAGAVAAATNAEGYNIYQTNGAVAGQIVPHVHFHIIPRRAGDKLGFRWQAGKYADGELEQWRLRILAKIAK